MFQTELIAGSYSLDLTEEIPISLNFSIADIRNPEKRNGAFSKTIKLLGTKTNNKFFEHFYEVNVATNTFNANLKTACYIIQDGSVVFEGDLRLREVSKILQNDIEEISYSVEIYGDNKTLFAEIGDSKLEDLDLSAYDHTYDRITQYNTWTATQGVGYCYPVIDYGQAGNFTTQQFKVEWLRPAVYVKQYVDSIFSDAGKTYTSTFFGTSFFKSLIIPHNGDKFTMSGANKALNEFYVGDSGAGTATNISMNYNASNGGWLPSYQAIVNNQDITAIFNDDTTSPFVDSNNLYNTSTGIFTPNSSAPYTLSANLNFQIKFNHSLTFTTVTINQISYQAYVLYRPTALSNWNIIGVKSGFIPTSAVTFSASYTTVNLNYTESNIVLTQGYEYKVIYRVLVGSPVAVYLNGASPVTTGTASFDARLASTATLKLSLLTADYQPNQTITINDAIPKDIKQRDFLISIIKMFNLYVDIDANDSNNYIIEPRDDFYAAGGIKNWSDKLAWDKPFNLKPTVTEMDFKRFIYTYKDDQDYYNKTYQDSWGVSYGRKTLDVTNDFTKAENKTEVIFSPTMVIDNPNNDLIIPKIFTYDGTTVKPSKHNLRILIFNGSVTNTIGWTYVYSGTDALGTGNVLMTSYGQAAMVDNPLAPTESIEFGMPNEVYYTLPSTYTNNNLYNRFYSKSMNELTDRDSKVITCYMYLEPIDIANFDFRDAIYVKDTYYLVNKIFDYNPISKDLTKVELLKLKNYNQFVADNETSARSVTTDVGNTGMRSRSFGINNNETNVGNADNVIIGDNNRSLSTGSFISGSDNVVAGDTYRVTIVSGDSNFVLNGASGVSLVNCSGTQVYQDVYNVNLNNCFDCIVEEGVYDVVGINLVGRTITSADSGRVLVESLANYGIISQTKTTDFNIDSGVHLYYIDCTSGNITATFDFSTDSNRNIFFVRIDNSANLFKIDEISGTATLQGSGVPVDLGMTQWQSLEINNDGTDFFII